MRKDSPLGRGAVAVGLVLSLMMPACITLKTNTDIRVEPYDEAVTVYKPNPGAPDGYAAEAVRLTRYRLAKTQERVLDLGQTILSTLEIVSSACLSIAMYLMLNQARTIGR